MANERPKPTKPKRAPRRGVEPEAPASMTTDDAPDTIPVGS